MANIMADIIDIMTHSTFTWTHFLLSLPIIYRYRKLKLYTISRCSGLKWSRWLKFCFGGLGGMYEWHVLETKFSR